MKTLICDWAVKTVIPFLKLFSIFILIILSSQTFAQGWTFCPQVQSTGCTMSGTQNTIITPMKAEASSICGYIFTQSQCESMRQQLLAIRISIPQFNDRAVYSGECSIYYTCTPCIGSDIIVSNQANQANQVNPGDVTFDGQFQGKPFFTSHQSSAFSDWAKNYQQTLESYGITSILGKKLSAYQIPLTGNIKFDEAYLKASSNFNPKVTTPITPIHNDASVVDLRDIKEGGVVQLLTTPEQQKKRDEWMKGQGLDNLIKIPNDGIPNLDESNFILEEGDFWTKPEMIQLELTALSFAIGFAPSASVGFVAPLAVDALAGVLKGEGSQKIIGDATGSVLSNVLSNVVAKRIGKILPGAVPYYEFFKETDEIVIKSWQLIDK